MCCFFWCLWGVLRAMQSETATPRTRKNWKPNGKKQIQVPLLWLPAMCKRGPQASLHTWLDEVPLLQFPWSPYLSCMCSWGTLVGSFIVNAVHKTRFRILYICTHQIDIMKAPSRCSWRQAIFRCQRGWVGHNRDRGPRSGTWEKEKANMDRNGWGGLNRSKYWFIVLDCISVFHCGCYVVFHYVLLLLRMFYVLIVTHAVI